MAKKITPKQEEEEFWCVVKVYYGFFIPKIVEKYSFRGTEFEGERERTARLLKWKIQNPKGNYAADVTYTALKKK